MRRTARLAVLFATLPALARTDARRENVLPPERPWAGKSRALVRPANDPWATPAETSGLTTTPRYDETVAWLRKLVAASSNLAMLSLGQEPRRP